MTAQLHDANLLANVAIILRVLADSPDDPRASAYRDHVAAYRARWESFSEGERADVQRAANASHDATSEDIARAVSALSARSS